MWELDCKESWMLRNWYFLAVVLEKTLEHPLDCKEIQPVHPKGDQSWIFIGSTDAEVEVAILWPPYAKSWFIRKDPDAGKDWRKEERGMIEDKMVGWHQWLGGHELEQALGVGEGQEAWHVAVHGVSESEMSEELNNSNVQSYKFLKCQCVMFCSPESSGPINTQVQCTAE